MKKRTFLTLGVAAGAVVLAAPTLMAEPSRRRPWRPVRQPMFSVQLEDEQGTQLPTFMHRGQTFVLGEIGRRYAVRVVNRTPRRVEAVLSVDGRDGLSGRSADFARDRGYVVPAHGSVVVDGFRTSMNTVAAFRFTTPSSSYSARMGTPQNVGVVGIALFSEKQERPVEVAAPARDGRRAAPEAKAKKQRSRSAEAERSQGERQDSLGTGWGETRMSRVRQVSFERRNRMRPDRVLTVRYDDADGLRLRGIRVPMDRPVERTEPQAFPGRR